MQLEEVGILAGLHITHGERAFLHNPIDGLPHVDESHAALQQVLCFIAERVLGLPKEPRR